MEKYIDISGLWPDLYSVWPFPGLKLLNAEYLSASFILIMLIIAVSFLLKAFYSYLKTARKVNKLNKRLSGKSPTAVSSGDSKNQVDHLWNEFSQTLIEVASVDAHGKESISIYNTIDSNHFFNTSTLASGLTENRMLAAVPGFLTGLGVLGTFIGLQLGLSELNIGNDVAVEEMKTGLAQVISGAQIAFLTSVWGVGLSLAFNFFEKWLERSARGKIKKVQNRIDAKYPRLTPERQLQQISDNSGEMRESLQHLGEKIGNRLQAAITNLGDRIIEPITGLAGETGDANKNVLNTLIQEFLDKFKEVGGDQAEEMKKANERFATALNSLDSSIALLLKQLEDNQNKNADREQELIKSMSDKVDELVVKSNEQHKILAEFVGKTLTDIGKGETARNDSTDNLLKRLEDAMKNQLEASGKLIKQGESLQQGLNASVQGNVEASTRLKESAIELNLVSQHMKGTGRSIENAGNTLSDSISKAVDGTVNLSEGNRVVQSLLNAHQQTLDQQHDKLTETVIKINGLLDSTQHSFEIMDKRQQEYIDSLVEHVSELSVKIAENLTDYSKGLNSTTQDQLQAWSKNTIDYTTSMNGAINSLKNVVDEIDSKLGKSN